MKLEVNEEQCGLKGVKDNGGITVGTNTWFSASNHKNNFPLHNASN